MRTTHDSDGMMAADRARRKGRAYRGHRGVASAPDVDVAMKLGAGHPMGPIQLADYIGLDTIHNIISGWVADFPDNPSFQVPASLKAKVDAGQLGRKTGQGYYKWEGDKLAA